MFEFGGDGRVDVCDGDREDGGTVSFEGQDQER